MRVGAAHVKKRRVRRRMSAGLLLYREKAGCVDVLLVHPGGPFWERKDDGAWSIPKGEFGDDEEPLEAARREFAEEIGVRPDGLLTPLDSSRGPSTSILTPACRRATRSRWNGRPNRVCSRNFQR